MGVHFISHYYCGEGAGITKVQMIQRALRRLTSFLLQTAEVGSSLIQRANITELTFQTELCVSTRESDSNLTTHRQNRLYSSANQLEMKCTCAHTANAGFFMILSANVLLSLCNKLRSTPTFNLHPPPVTVSKHNRLLNVT